MDFFYIMIWKDLIFWILKCVIWNVFGLQRGIWGMLVKSFIFLKNRIRLMMKILGYLTGF